jgi:hypothetical protein
MALIRANPSRPEREALAPAAIAALNADGSAANANHLPRHGLSFELRLVNAQ